MTHKILLSLGAFYAVTIVSSAQAPAPQDALIKRIQALEKRVEDLEKLRGFLPAPGLPAGSPAAGKNPRNFSRSSTRFSNAWIRLISASCGAGACALETMVTA